jgi:hypothetical protein
MGEALDRQDPGSRTRKASPTREERAPQSKRVAHRLLNSAGRPLQRFDSADYFLAMHDQEQRRIRDGAEELPRTAESVSAEHAQPVTSVLDQPMLPPPLDRDVLRMSMSSPHSVEQPAEPKAL